MDSELQSYINHMSVSSYYCENYFVEASLVYQYYESHWGCYKEGATLCCCDCLIIVAMHGRLCSDDIHLRILGHINTSYQIPVQTFIPL